MINQVYVDHVERAGGIALLIPPRPDADAEFVDAVLSRVDGLIVSGGGDIDPALFGQEPHPASHAPQVDRDVTELALVASAVERDLPMLGICRGIQVMAVVAGGTIEQHVPDRVGGNAHSPVAGRFGSHPVRVAGHSRLGRVLGESLDVPTHHHQAVATHPGYVAVAWHADDTIEAIEAEESAHARFRCGVQWHPEESGDNRIFQELVRAAHD